MNQKKVDSATIAERLRDDAKIEEALNRAGRKAALEHARAGRAIPFWRNNQVVWEVPKVEDYEDKV